MELAAANAFLNTVMSSVPTLEKLYAKHESLEEEIDSIKRHVRYLAANMDDDRRRAMGARQGRTAVGRLHSEEMLDLMHEVEDCIDRFAYRLSCKQRGAGAGTSSSVSLGQQVAQKLKLKKLQNMPVRASFADEIGKLKRRITESQEHVTRMGGGQATAAGAGCATRTPFRVACDHPVGIEKANEELVSLLDMVEGEAKQPRVISIVGFGGSGKTTLARAVYDSRANEFDCCAWVAAAAARPSPEASSDEIRGDIIRDILQQVVGRDAMDDDEPSHEAKLRNCLQDKRYLIVIDDISMELWKNLKSVFKDNCRCGRILLTTTIRSVAKWCSSGNGYVHQMSTLGEADSKKIAFDWVTSPDLERHSPTLLKKCDGLPLALVSVCDHLKCNGLTGVECLELCHKLGSHLIEKPENKTFTELTRVLMDSYESLSSCTLTCLLYLGIFPNNRPLKRKVVTRRWLAEGYARDDFFQREHGDGDGNFKTLLDQCIIQPIDTSNNEQVKTFKTHGIVHEFVLHKSLAWRFVGPLPHDYPTSSVSIITPRHLSIHDGHWRSREASDEDLSRVRSLTVTGKAGNTMSYVQRCKLLRVLDVEQCTDLEDSHLTHIDKLWLLKYLSLGGTITKLPCIKGMNFLETLDLRRTNINAVPIEAIKLPHLAHLFGKFMLDRELKEKEMTKLQKFLSEKSNLETIAGFIADERQGFLQLMGHMRKARKVKIWCGLAANDSNLSRAIQEFTKGPMDRIGDRSLSLDSEGCSEVFSSLDFEACPEGLEYVLRSLKIRGMLPQLPPFVTKLSALTELCISSATLTRGLVSSLIHLRYLLYLKLIAHQLENFQMENGSFPSLRGICFLVQNLTPDRLTAEQGILPTITIEEGALENLFSLQLLCGGLVDLSGIKIRHLERLKEVTVDAGGRRGIKQDWERAVKNHPKRPRLVILNDPTENEGAGQEIGAVKERRKSSAEHPSICPSIKKQKV